MSTENKSKEKYLKEIEKKLDASDASTILKTLDGLKSYGKVEVIPLVIDLLLKNKDAVIKKEILNFLGDINDQKVASLMIKEIVKKKNEPILAEIISTCWMSRLDYSMHLNVFCDCFINKNFVTSLEAFTVIEESLHNASDKYVNECKEYLISRRSKIASEKQVLFRELLKVIDGKY